MLHPSNHRILALFLRRVSSSFHTVGWLCPSLTTYLNLRLQWTPRRPPAFSGLSVKTFRYTLLIHWNSRICWLYFGAAEDRKRCIELSRPPLLSELGLNFCHGYTQLLSPTFPNFESFFFPSSTDVWLEVLVSNLSCCVLLCLPWLVISVGRIVSLQNRLAV